MSYIAPITIFTENSEQHESLKIRRYQGQWLLESKDALYSEGNSYKPFKFAFAHIKNDIPAIQHFLLLGAGLCSAVKIMQEKYNHFPACDIVDYDEKILSLNKKIPTLQSFENIKFHCAHAEDFITETTNTYDLIGIDLFEGMTLTPVVLSNVFLKEIKQLTNKKSYVVINTIFSSEKEANAYERQLRHYFLVEKVNYQPNYIFICNPIT